MGGFHDKDIYSIQIGHLPNGLSFRIGQQVRAHTISQILRNDEHFFQYGLIVYEIWGKDAQGNEELLKACENQPVYLSFSNDEHNDN